ncbi:translocation/assembly module TamB domain-containing protein [Leisingera sp. M658]|uniref:translocation/assembly module TamB domain-containing protein n=1 Tax=Leisingera sp. M658 TaxID=2867015 RepID=UPI0021A3A1A2|nr:translocation/assembly module TamB domain-containing protein [Leisingera sp. M658]UWQ73906.1 translocation/assembly module TamB domain-containing protein [Leisingera sp. M658]
MRQFLGLALALGLTVAPAAAQDTTTEDAGGLLVDFLEDTLSGDSRYISVTGLEGAFSSEAKIKRITVADEDGIWLTVEGAELDWNRLALLSGRFSVNELSAERIEVARAPKPLPPDPELPEPEATPFALPELPVAIELGQIKAARIELGEDLAGSAASLSVEGSLMLADGTLDTKLAATRLDKPGDHFRLEAGYANETRQITLDLAVEESPGGLISRSLDLPGSPELQLTAQGSGPVSDFTADIRFSTNGAERLTGQVVLAAVPLPADAAPEAPRDIGFSADLGGNIDVLLPPVHRPFFGPGLRLNVKGTRAGSGAVALDTLALRTNALQVTGAAALDAGGKLDTANLKTAITAPAGQAAVTLPFGGGLTTLAAADLQLKKTAGGNWTLDGVLDQLSHPGALVGRAEVSGQGTLDQSTGFALKGRLTAGLSNLQPRDPALAKATGNEIRFEGTLSTEGPGALQITDMELRGSDYQAAGDVGFDGLEDGLKVSADLTAGLADLARFSDLAGRPLGGAVQAKVKGSFTPLSGAFNTDLSMRAQDLSAGIAQADELLKGTTTLALKAARDENGIAIDRFELAGSALLASAAGTLNSDAGRMEITARLNRLEVLLPQTPGALELATTLIRNGDTLDGVAELKGPHTSSAKLDGSVTLEGDADFTFAAALNELERFVPQLAGKLTAQGTAARRNGEWQIAGQAAGPAAITADIEGRFTESNGSTDLRFDAAIGQLQRLVPDLPGRLAAKGTAARRDGTWTIDSTASGPAGIDSRVAGSWSEAKGTADVTAKGTLRLEGLNPFISPNLMQGPANFDLALRGVPALDGLSGTISVPGASLAIPSAAQRVDDINATVSIARSSAQLRVSARPRDGGTVRISGPVGLQPPFNGNLQIAIGDVVVTDHLSYETLLNGSLAMSGAMAGNNRIEGRIDVGETNINLNTAGGSVSAAPIPPIRHIGTPRDVRQTLARAGLTGSSGGGGGSGRTELDILISAPSRIFARGRGLRSELGGEIRLRGTTARLSPSGQISLIRGTFDILGRRLELDEGRITLLGDLKPYLEFKSSAATDQGTATLEISGRVDAPEIKVTSDPPRPSEEALALLLFGDNIQDISPLALARLAGSALTLSGRGGSAQNKLRNATGADDVDIGADNLGSGQLGLGGYVAENVYTDFNVNTRGDSELSINLDMTDSLTVQGTVDSEGETGFGLFFKRDY